MTIRASTVREFIKEVQLELQPGVDLPPARARELLGSLSAIVGNLFEDIRDADLDYANVLLQCLEAADISGGKANRAKIAAETTPAYQRKREAEHAFKHADELITSLRCMIRSQEAEMRLSR